MSVVPIHGAVAPGFETVQAEFEQNFTERGERGAACAIYYQGQKVVDLWGGYRDKQGYDNDSCEKGPFSLLLSLLQLKPLLFYTYEYIAAREV